MRGLFARRWLPLLAGGLAALCLATLSACWYFRVWSYEDYRAFREVRAYPAGEDLWFGRVKTGEDLRAFTAAHPPHRARRVGDFTVLSYYSVWPLPPNAIPMESLSVVARAGRLVHGAAAGCTWHRVFFAMTPDEQAALDEEYEQYWAQRERG